MFNQNFKKLQLSTKTSNDVAETKKPTEFLMLFDKLDGVENKITSKPLKYCEVYAGSENINLSLSEKNIETKLVTNITQLNDLKERLEIFSIL